MSGWLAGLLDSIGIVPAAPGLLDAPVGTSTMQRLTNPSPTVSPLASAMLNSSDQKIGRFWNAATGRAKQHYTGADMAQLTAAGNEGLDAALGWTGMTTPIRAFHGSPHTFDRFDLSKIGTGEGAQAYGHGLYFAGNEKVAKGYRDRLAAGTVPVVDGAPITGQTTAFDWLKNYGSVDEALKAIRGQIDSLTGKAPAGAFDHLMSGEKRAQYIRDLQDAATYVEANKGRIGYLDTPGSMYEVSLRTSPERLLDWDKPLSQQAPEVQRALMNHPNAHKFKPEWSGAQLHESPALVPGEFANKVEASKALRDTGLDGIQYLDAGSRAAGDGSRNYVMFRDDIIDILKRYGLLGMLGGGAAVGAEQ